MSEARKLAPDHPGFADLLGEILSRMGERELALEAFSDSARLSPRSWEAHYKVASLEARLGRKERALTALGEAARLDQAAVARCLEIDEWWSEYREDPSVRSIFEDEEIGVTGAPKK
jgi:tetratricopeptide (TPR) repeat protein